jgi:hypothetical protein
MSDPIRLLNTDAIEEFRRYLVELRRDPLAQPPTYLLTSSVTSSDPPFEARLEREPTGVPFTSRYEFGKYLVQVLNGVDGALISREHRLWTWLALYYFDQLCPPNKSGARKPLDDAAYVLDSEFNWTTYYRHFVRTPWIAVSLHPVQSRVVLTPLRDFDRPLAQRGELVEQMASRQSLFRSRTVMTVADRLYYDPATDRLRRGAGGSTAGSSRRLAAVLNQFDLTYDLESVTPETVISRLPKEFDRWTAALAST